MRKFTKTAAVLALAVAAAAETGLPAVSEAAGKQILFCSQPQLYSYQSMEQDIHALQVEYGSLLKVDSIGTTADGRKLYQIIIGDPKAKKHILVFGSIHAREYITTSVVMMQAETLLRNLKSPQAEYHGIGYQELLKDTAVHIVPMVNPDGVSISQFGLEGLQKAETRQTLYRIYEMDDAVELEPYLRMWKSNAEGVDLNRNFDALWSAYNDHLGHPSSDHYKGEKPESTAEAAALTALTDKYQFDRTISYHARGNVIYWYFAQQGTFLDESRRFAEAIGQVTGYPLDADYEKLDPAGYKDWAIQKKQIPSLTIEVGTGDVPVNMNQLPEIYEKNKYVIDETLYTLR